MTYWLAFNFLLTKGLLNNDTKLRVSLLILDHEFMQDPYFHLQHLQLFSRYPSIIILVKGKKSISKIRDAASIILSIMVAIETYAGIIAYPKL